MQVNIHNAVKQLQMIAMYKIRTFCLLVTLLLSVIFVGAQSISHNDLRRKIEIINAQISQAYYDQNAATIVSYYNNDGTCMPEYHKTLYNKTALSKYFQQWFAAAKSNIYTRTIYSVESIKNYIIELGTFKNIFIKGAIDTFVYKGKYIRFWKIEKNKKLTIMSDIWGADDYLDRSKFPVIENTGPALLPKYSVNDKIKEEVEKRNNIITGLVKKRQGEQHSSFFTQDAIYMPYYKPMLIGLDSIKSYFIEHEKTGDVNIDSLQINASKIIDIGNFILEQGYYGVRWTSNDNNTGVVTGKSINIWKRNSKGVLMLYRQMVNHD